MAKIKSIRAQAERSPKIYEHFNDLLQLNLKVLICKESEYVELIRQIDPAPKDINDVRIEKPGDIDFCGYMVDCDTPSAARRIVYYFIYLWEDAINIGMIETISLVSHEVSHLTTDVMEYLGIKDDELRSLMNESYNRIVIRMVEDYKQKFLSREEEE